MDATRAPSAPRRSPRKRDAILAAAQPLFLARGYVGTSVDEIALAAGVSKQTVYGHFGSKEGLFHSLISALTGDAGDRVHVVDDAPSTPEALRALLVDYAERQLRIAMDPQLLRLRRLVIGEVERFPDLAAALYDRGPARAISSFAALLSASASTGAIDLGGLSAEAAGERLNWLIMGGPLHRAMLLGDASAPTPAQRRAHAEEAVSVFLSSVPEAS